MFVFTEVHKRNEAGVLHMFLSSVATVFVIFATFCAQAASGFPCLVQNEVREDFCSTQLSNQS
jgi:hypothetical protein